MTHKISFLYLLSPTISFNKVIILLLFRQLRMEGEGGGGGGDLRKNTCIYALGYEHESVDKNVNVGVTMC